MPDRPIREHDHPLEEVDRRSHPDWGIDVVELECGSPDCGYWRVTTVDRLTIGDYNGGVDDVR